MSRFVVDVQHSDGGAPLPEPGFIARSVTRLRDAKAIFTEYDHGYSQAFSPSDDIHRRWIMLCSGRQSVGVKDQRHISTSIRSESSSIKRLIRAVSLRRCRSLPMCLTQGFSELLASEASLSLTASVTNSRSGIPRAAATDLARRKTGSGISRVVFTKTCSHIYGSKVNPPWNPALQQFRCYELNSNDVNAHR